MWPGATHSWRVTPEGDLYGVEWVVRLVPVSGTGTARSQRR